MRKVLFQKRTLIIIIAGAVVTFLIFLYTTFFVQKQNLVSPDLNIFDRGITSIVGVSTLTPLGQITNTVSGNIAAINWRSDGMIAIAYDSGIIQIRDHSFNVEKTIDNFNLSIPTMGSHTYTGLPIGDISWSPITGDNRLALDNIRN